MHVAMAVTYSVRERWEIHQHSHAHRSLAPACTVVMFLLMTVKPFRSCDYQCGVAAFTQGNEGGLVHIGERAAYSAHEQLISCCRLCLSEAQ